MADTSRPRRSWPARMLRGTLAVVAILVVAIVLLAQVVSLNMLKPRIEAYTSTALGLPTTVKGDIRASFLHFWPAVVLGDVQIGQKGKGSLYQAEKMTVSVPIYKPFGERHWSFLVGLSNLRIDGLDYGDYRTPVDFYYPDGLVMHDIEGSLEDARLEGVSSIRDNKLDIDVKLTGLDYARFAKGLRGGNARVNVQLKADTKKLMQTLSGHVLLSGDKGHMDGNAIDLWAGDLLMNILSGPQKETVINCVVADFNVKNGIAQSNATVIDTPHVSVYGKGNVNLARQYVDMRFTPKPKNASLLNLATPVSVSGPFDDISAEPDPLGVVEKIGNFFVGAVTSPMALVPFAHLGDADDVSSPCLKYVSKKAR